MRFDSRFKGFLKELELIGPMSTIFFAAFVRVYFRRTTLVNEKSRSLNTFSICENRKIQQAKPTQLTQFQPRGAFNVSTQRRYKSAWRLYALPSSWVLSWKKGQYKDPDHSCVGVLRNNRESDRKRFICKIAAKLHSRCGKSVEQPSPPPSSKKTSRLMPEIQVPGSSHRPQCISDHFYSEYVSTDIREIRPQFFDSAVLRHTENNTSLPEIG